ncbi:hypothetical protein [Epilithonimonas zeae]|uniref:hypothetical protein n=1 Tax=Epilithonimonas zeae TaxID=1416779 RepID=UPI00200DE906|nr:hypothetical protein [Epilithonimonas zeae]UQB69501.1 hypothetical protein KI430_03475 [Epilithonimonas zeae]
MKALTYLLIAFFILLNCSDDSIKTMDFGDFQIQTPRHWKELKSDACDSNAGIIVTKNKDSIHFDYGMYSNSLDENPIIINRTMLKEILLQDSKIDTTELIIVENIEKVNREDYLKSKISYKNIDGYNAKILIPKKIGNGMTGIYIDKIKTELHGEVKFNFMGENLSKQSQTELLTAINTLKFTK